MKALNFITGRNKKKNEKFKGTNCANWSRYSEKNDNRKRFFLEIIEFYTDKCSFHVSRNYIKANVS